VAHHVVGIGLHHFTRDRHHVRHREEVGEVEVGFLQLEADRVAVAHLDAGDGRVHVERRARLLRLLHELVQADQLVLEEPLIRAREARIAKAADRVRDVLRRELALLALEHRIVREEDARPDAERVASAALLGQRHRLRDERHELHGPREVVVVSSGSNRLSQMPTE
jgi:hypothetical protein